MGIDIQSDHHHADAIRSDALIGLVLIPARKVYLQFFFIFFNIVFPYVQINISKTRLNLKNSFIQCGISVYARIHTHRHVLLTPSADQFHENTVARNTAPLLLLVSCVHIYPDRPWHGLLTPSIKTCVRPSALVLLCPPPPTQAMTMRSIRQQLVAMIASQELLCDEHGQTGGWL